MTPDEMHETQSSHSSDENSIQNLLTQGRNQGERIRARVPHINTNRLS